MHRNEMQTFIIILLLLLLLLLAAAATALCLMYLQLALSPPEHGAIVVRHLEVSALPLIFSVSMSLIKRLTQFFQLSPNVKQAAKDQRAREVFLGRIAAGAGKRKRRGTMAFPPPQPTTPAAALPTPTAVHSAAEEAKAAAALAAPLWGDSTLEGFGGSGGGPWSETTPSDLLKSMLPALEKLKNLVFTFKYVRINTLSVRVNLRGKASCKGTAGLWQHCSWLFCTDQAKQGMIM